MVPSTPYSLSNPPLLVIEAQPEAHGMQLPSGIHQDRIMNPTVNFISSSPHLHHNQSPSCTKNLMQIHQEAKAKCQAHLDELISAAAVCKETKCKQLILNLKRVEELR